MEYLELLFSPSNLLLLVVVVMAVFITLSVVYNSKSFDERGGILNLKNKTLAVLCTVFMFLAPILLGVYVLMFPLEITNYFIRLGVRILMFFGFSIAAGIISMIAAAICLTRKYNKTKKQNLA